MNRRLAITIIACLFGLWLANASAQDKFNPPPINKVDPPPAIQIKPKDPIVPPPKLPPVPLPAAPATEPIIEPVVPPPTLPAAPTTVPVVEPKVPARTLPLDPTGGHIGKKELEELEAARAAAAAGKLAEQESGLDATMGAGPVSDPSSHGSFRMMGGAGIQPNDPFEELCKRASFRRLVGGLGICAGSPDDSDGLPPDGEIVKTEPQFKPAPTGVEGGPTAGGRVPRRDGPASDDPDYTYKDEDGNQHDVWVTNFQKEDGFSANFVEVVRRGNGDVVYVRDGYTVPDRSPGAQRGDYRNVQHTTQVGGIQVTTSRRCRGWCDPDSQPGESGYGHMKARPWFCARNPKAKGCEPTAPGSQIDPANPDGEGTPTGPRPATHRLGRESVSDPGPGDSEIRGTTGGGSSGPLDMKDPARPRP